MKNIDIKCKEIILWLMKHVSWDITLILQLYKDKMKVVTTFMLKKHFLGKRLKFIRQNMSCKY